MDEAKEVSEDPAPFFKKRKKMFELFKKIKEDLQCITDSKNGAGGIGVELALSVEH